jgi:tight adherence protein B
LRERLALRAERQAQAASARLSTRVMTVLPFAFTGFVAVTDADVRGVLLHTPVGWTCLTVGVALNVAGRAWAKRAVAA